MNRIYCNERQLFDKCMKTELKPIFPFYQIRNLTKTKSRENKKNNNWIFISYFDFFYILFVCPYVFNNFSILITVSYYHSCSQLFSSILFHWPFGFISCPSYISSFFKSYLTANEIEPFNRSESQQILFGSCMIFNRESFFFLFSSHFLN